MLSSRTRSGKLLRLSSVSSIGYVVRRTIFLSCSVLVLTVSLNHAVPIADAFSATAYKIDASQSSFMVHAGVHGLLSALGHNHNIAVKDFSGTAVFDPDNPSACSLELRVRAASLTVIDKIKDSDKQGIEKTMRDQVLEVSKYPEITFRSTSVSITKTGEGQYRADMWGDLSLHGVTKRGFIRAALSLQGNTLRAKGEFPIVQTDYKIQPVSVAGGTIKVKNELKLDFDLVATR